MAAQTRSNRVTRQSRTRVSKKEEHAQKVQDCETAERTQLSTSCSTRPDDEDIWDALEHDPEQKKGEAAGERDRQDKETIRGNQKQRQREPQPVRVGWEDEEWEVEEEQQKAMQTENQEEEEEEEDDEEEEQEGEEDEGDEEEEEVEEEEKEDNMTEEGREARRGGAQQEEIGEQQSENEGRGGGEGGEEEEEDEEDQDQEEEEEDDEEDEDENEGEGQEEQEEQEHQEEQEEDEEEGEEGEGYDEGQEGEEGEEEGEPHEEGQVKTVESSQVYQDNPQKQQLQQQPQQQQQQQQQAYPDCNAYNDDEYEEEIGEDVSDDKKYINLRAKGLKQVHQNLENDRVAPAEHINKPRRHVSQREVQSAALPAQAGAPPTQLSSNGRAPKALWDSDSWPRPANGPPSRAGVLQGADHKDKEQKRTPMSMGKMRVELQRLEAENRTLRSDLGQERYKVQQLSRMRDEVANAHQRELQAKQEKARADREAQQAKSWVTKRMEFSRSEKAELLLQIKQLEVIAQEATEREVTLRAEFQEGVRERESAAQLVVEANLEKDRWHKEAIEHATKLKQAEKRCEQLEQKRVEDKAKIKALAEQLRINVEAASALEKQQPLEATRLQVPMPEPIKGNAAKRSGSSKPPKEGKGAAGAFGKDGQKLKEVAFLEASSSWSQKFKPLCCCQRAVVSQSSRDGVQGVLSRWCCPARSRLSRGNPAPTAVKGSKARNTPRIQKQTEVAPASKDDGSMLLSDHEAEEATRQRNVLLALVALIVGLATAKLWN